MQNRIIPHKSTFDWPDLLLILSNPLTELSRDFNGLLLKKNLEQREINEFQEQLIFITYTEQERVKAQLLRELDHDEDAKQARILESWAKSNIKTISADDLSAPEKGLLGEILAMLVAVSQLTLHLTASQAKQKTLSQAWMQQDEKRVDKLIDLIRSGDVKLYTPYGEELKLTEEKEAQLREAAKLVDPYMAAHVIHGFAERMRDNNAYENFLRIGAAFTELKMNALTQDQGDEPGPDADILTGAALLAAIRRNREGMKELFRNLEADFNAQLGQVKEGFDSFLTIQADKREIKNTDEQIKEKSEELKNALLGIKPKLSSGKKLTDEEFEALQKMSKKGI